MNSNDNANGAAEHKDEALVGVTIDERYRVIEKVGEGGMSIVYRVEHLILHRQLALKMLNAKSAASPAVVKRFTREAMAMSKLKHTNVVEVVGCGIWQQSPYLVMEFLEGKTLAQRIRDSERLTIEEAGPIFLQICDALQEAHARGIIHRDLKPSNVVLLEGGKTVKLVDFGIAALISDEKLQKLTQTGDIFGTVQYMSPEQCMGKAVDCRSDIYSFGCLMFETLTGKPPFTGDSAFEVVSKQLNESPPQHPLLCNLQTVVLASLQKNPDCRPASVEALKELIQAPQSVAAAKQGAKGIAFNRRSLFHAAFATAVCATFLLGCMFFFHQAGQPALDPEIEAARVLSHVDLNNLTPEIRESLGQALTHLRSSEQNHQQHRILQAEVAHDYGLYLVGDHQLNQSLSELNQEMSDGYLQKYCFHQWCQLMIEKAVTYGRMGDFSRAKRTLETVVEQNENAAKPDGQQLAAAYLPLASYYAEKNDFINAELTYKKCIDLQDSDTAREARFQLATFYKKMFGLAKDPQQRSFFGNKALEGYKDVLTVASDGSEAARIEVAECEKNIESLTHQK